MRMTTLNGIRVHHDEGGDPDGSPLVFANSLGTDLRVWDALLPHLPPGHRVIRYDMRGHGLTDAPEGEYWMGDLVADAASLMDHLGIQGATFIGLSIGGVVAQGLAAERPDLLRALILSNTAAKIGTPDIWAERIAAVRAGGVEALADGTMTRWFSPRFHAERADELAGWRNMLTRTPVAGYVGCCMALAETDLSNVTYIYSETDEQVGRLTDTEISFLLAQGARVVSDPGGHEDAIEGGVSQELPLMLGDR